MLIKCGNAIASKHKIKCVRENYIYKSIIPNRPLNILAPILSQTRSTKTQLYVTPFIAFTPQNYDKAMQPLA